MTLLSAWEWDEKVDTVPTLCLRVKNRAKETSLPPPKRMSKWVGYMVLLWHVQYGSCMFYLGIWILLSFGVCHASETRQSHVGYQTVIEDQEGQPFSVRRPPVCHMGMKDLLCLEGGTEKAFFFHISLAFWEELHWLIELYSMWSANATIYTILLKFSTVPLGNTNVSNSIITALKHSILQPHIKFRTKFFSLNLY